MTERIAEGAKIRRQSVVTVINALRSRRGDRSTLALLDGQRLDTARRLQLQLARKRNWDYQRR
jgi:hypothetical protein